MLSEPHANRTAIEEEAKWCKGCLNLTTKGHFTEFVLYFGRTFHLPTVAVLDKAQPNFEGGQDCVSKYTATGLAGRLKRRPFVSFPSLLKR